MEYNDSIRYFFAIYIDKRERIINNNYSVCTNSKKSFLYRRCISVVLIGCESTAVYNPQSNYFRFLSSEMEVIELPSQLFVILE